MRTITAKYAGYCKKTGARILAGDLLIEAALVAVIDAIENDDSDQGLQSAERAIALLKTYLYEVKE